MSKFIVPINPSQGAPWTEPIDEEVDVRQLYQIHNNEDYTEPNIHGELHLGNQDSISYNSDAELYDWEIENCETQARGCWIIQKVQKKPTQQCFVVSIIPKNFKKKIREHPTLQPTNLHTTQNSRPGQLLRLSLSNSLVEKS